MRISTKIDIIAVTFINQILTFGTRAVFAHLVRTNKTTDYTNTAFKAFATIYNGWFAAVYQAT